MDASFETTDAWKMARMLTNLVYDYCRRDPLAHDFGLRDQLQRAAVSVMNNVAEGWESMHTLEKRQAYNYARRSCGEVRSMGYVLLDNKFISIAEHARLTSLCVQSGKLVSGLIRSQGNRQVRDPKSQAQDPS